MNQSATGFSGPHNGIGFLNPTDLRVGNVAPRRVAFIGSCLIAGWKPHDRSSDGCIFDFFTVNHAAELPDIAAEAAPYDLQVIQIALNSLLAGPGIWPLAYSDVAGYEAVFAAACRQLEFILRLRMKWNMQHGILTFVSNFLIPQHTPLGGLLPKYDLRNPEHFIYRLNEELERLVRGYANAYLLDVDRICASFGRRFIQDDSVVFFSHNAFMGLPPSNVNRIEPMPAMVDHYRLNWPSFMPDAIWAEIVSLYRVAYQADAVKLVIVDLDDTLWNGVSGEIERPSPAMQSGWAGGFAEALAYLKKRGVLLAIASKNDEARIRSIWPQIFGRTLSLDDFAVVRINWRPKPENIAEILDGLNLLPGSAVFIDDNPAERAAAVQAFPELRVLGRHPYYLRRILLWSAETQVVAISAEAARRTEMSQAQLQRGADKGILSRAEFLAKAAPEIAIFWMSDVSDAQFLRVLELINRTNQFNTTGQRRTLEEMRRFFERGGRVLAFATTDSYTDYGLTGVVLIRGAIIVQWVMSCRILGYDIEHAVLAGLLDRMKPVAGRVLGLMIETKLNMPCRGLFRQAGFSPRGSNWVARAGSKPAAPAHISVSW